VAPNLTDGGSVAVFGTGPGGLAIAADLSLHKRDVVVCDLPAFAHQVEAVGERGGITVRSPGGADLVPVRSTMAAEAALDGVGLVIVSVPALAHETFVRLLSPHLRPGLALLFVGEGSGSLVAWGMVPENDRVTLLLGEMNCLPFISRAAGPGEITVDRKRGGVLLSAMPSSRTPELLAMVNDVWPFVEAAGSVWETTLVNYDTIDIVPVAIANAGTLEGRTGGILLWGEGATPSVVRVIEAVDGELLALRIALGLTDRRRYRDLLIAQGLAPNVGDLFAVMRAGGITRSVRPSGDESSLVDRLALEVRYSLVLASSIGDAVGVATPVIDGLIAVADAMVGPGLRSEGRTLSSLGLGDLDAQQLRAHVAG
jgi:opine dehydrogenase